MKVKMLKPQIKSQIIFEFGVLKWWIHLQLLSNYFNGKSFYFIICKVHFNERNIQILLFHVSEGVPETMTHRWNNGKTKTQQMKINSSFSPAATIDPWVHKRNTLLLNWAYFFLTLLFIFSWFRTLIHLFSVNKTMKVQSISHAVTAVSCNFSGFTARIFADKLPR